MRILHFLKTGGYSGAEKVAISIISEMKRLYGYQGIYVSPSGQIDDMLKKKGIEHAVISVNGLKEYQRVVNEYRPDVIHSHDFSTTVLCSFIRYSGKRISHLHNNPIWFRKINLRTLVYQLAVRKCQYILGVSDSIFKEYVFGKSILKKSRVIGNPIDISGVRSSAEKAEEKEKSDVLFLGRLSAPKDPLRYINIMKQVSSGFDNLKGIMIGEGELRTECALCIQSLQMQNVIKILGFKENPYGYLKNTSVLCVPSKWEGFGLVVVEAFALGIPVVATPVGGMKDLIDNEVGFLSDNNEEISAEITRLLTDDKYYRLKSQKAGNKAKELNNIQAYMEQLFRLYT